MFRCYPFNRRMAMLTVIAVVAVAVCVGYIVWRSDTPSCSYPYRVRGDANSKQVGLVGCYLKALADRDQSALMKVADYDPPVKLTSADLAYSADVRSGEATVTFTPSPVDSTSLSVDIDYANGVRESTAMINMIAMGDHSGWRMVVGTPIDNSPKCTTCTKPGPGTGR